MNDGGVGTTSPSTPQMLPVGEKRVELERRNQSAEQDLESRG